MGKYDNQIIREQDKNLRNWTLNYTQYLEDANGNVEEVVKEWKKKAPEDTNIINAWFTTKRQQRLAKNINEAMKGDLVRSETFIEARYNREFVNAWYNKSYVTTQNGLQGGYDFQIGKPQQKQLKDAITNTLSKFMDRQAMNSSRARYITRVYRTVLTGLTNNNTLDDIYKSVDQVFGFRDRTGKLIPNKLNYKGISAEYKRLLVTEINRIRSSGDADEYKKELQQGVAVQLTYRAVIDGKTRPQSASMDGEIANAFGEFIYPDGNPYIQHQTGNPSWDINDRCFTERVDPAFPPKYRVIDGETVPYKNANQYYKDLGLKKNIYNQVYIPSRKQQIIKKDLERRGVTPAQRARVPLKDRGK